MESKNIDQTYIITTNDTLTPQEMVIELRKKTGMNRRQFCAYFGIPYRTVSEWEQGHRTMPDYLLRMMEYQLRMDQKIKEETETAEE